ncbi:MAG: hypothetical protein J0L57_04765 [Burkholderiales bacterium]|nr:hypothetical protein [Burkholderiales bacterium]
MDLPPDWRGRELGCDELVQAGARLEAFVVRAQTPSAAECACRP